MYHIIRVKESVSKLYAIEAKTPEDAEAIAKDLYGIGCIDAGCENHSVDFSVRAEELTAAEARRFADRVLTKKEIDKLLYIP